MQFPTPRSSPFSGALPWHWLHSVHEIYLQELLPTLGARKEPRKHRGSAPLGLELWNFSFCLGKGHGKLLGKLVTNTISYRATNECANTETIEKKKGKIQMALVQSLSPGRCDQLKWDCANPEP